MIGARNAVRSLIASFLMILSVVHASAIVPEPKILDTPVPTELRAPFARFLSELGVIDIDNTIRASKGFEWRDDGSPVRFVFRVIHPYACTPDQDECMTIIGHIENGTLISEAIFYAGNRINRADVAPQILGARFSLPWGFHSKTSIVAVVETVKGLMIASQPAAPVK
jgi:hypothetical protein